MHRYLFSAAAVIAFTFMVAGDARGQHRDYMTDAEIELVRDAQNIDLRIDVLTKMIDRRFTALGIDAGGWKEPAKESAKWGEAPAGTRVELLSDIRYLMQKAVDDIDDVAEHNENTLTQNKTTGLLFPKAVRSLEAAARRYVALLTPLAAASKDDKEKGMILNAIQLCGDVIDAAATLPPDKPKGKH